MLNSPFLRARIIKTDPTIYNKHPTMKGTLKKVKGLEKLILNAPAFQNICPDEVNMVQAIINKNPVRREDFSVISNYSSNKILTRAAYAGRAIKTPTDMPTMVVKANPFNNPAPAQNRGTKLPKLITYAPMMINSAFLILLFQSRLSASFRKVSSVITIKWFMPVPTTTTNPAIEAKSRFQRAKAAKPKIITSSLSITKTMGKIITAFL